MTPAPRLEVRRAADRAVTRTVGLTTWHAFATTGTYDPGNTSFGVLVALDEHRLPPGAGFAPHPHRDLEIVSWVLQGTLGHQDSAGAAGVLGPGDVQVLSAGSGVVHEERHAGGADEPLHLLQAWLVPDELGAAPRHAQRSYAEQLRSGQLVTLAAGADAAVPGRGPVPPTSPPTGARGAEPVSPLPLRRRGAALHAQRLAPGSSSTLPVAPYVHLLVTSGEVDAASDGSGSALLGPGDAVRATRCAPLRLTAREASEVLVLEMHTDLR